MSVIIISHDFESNQPDKAESPIVKELDITGWLKTGILGDSGSALVRLSIYLKGSSTATESLRLLVAGKAIEPTDASHIYHDRDYQEYVTMFVEQAGAINQTTDGMLFDDGTEEWFVNRVSTEVLNTYESCTEIQVEFEEALSEGERHLVTFQYEAPMFAKAFVPPVSKRQELDIRVYSIYDIWGDRQSRSRSQALKTQSLLVEDVSIWLGLPPGRSPVSLRPVPDRQTTITVQHPGYDSTTIETIDYTGVHWRFEDIDCDFGREDVEVHCQYDDASLAWRLIAISFVLTVLGAVFGFIALL